MQNTTLKVLEETLKFLNVKSFNEFNACLDKDALRELVKQAIKEEVSGKQTKANSINSAIRLKTIMTFLHDNKGTFRECYGYAFKDFRGLLSIGCPFFTVSLPPSCTLELPMIPGGKLDINTNMLQDYFKDVPYQNKVAYVVIKKSLLDALKKTNKKMEVIYINNISSGETFYFKFATLAKISKLCGNNDYSIRLLPGSAKIPHYWKCEADNITGVVAPMLSPKGLSGEPDPVLYGTVKDVRAE